MVMGMGITDETKKGTVKEKRKMQNRYIGLGKTSIQKNVFFRALPESPKPPPPCPQIGQLGPFFSDVIIQDLKVT